MAQLERLKLSATVWESDKDPTGFNQWLDTVSALVRATEDGEPLEDFIQHKTGRVTFQRGNVPSFLLEDDDFNDDDPIASDRSSFTTRDTRDPTTSDTVDPNDVPLSALFPPASPLARRAAARSTVTRLFPGSSATPGVGRRDLQKAPTAYRDLPDRSKQLDRLLYNVLKMIVKGSKASMLDCVMKPSYVQGVIVLINHMDISKFDRITAAIFRMDRLQYNGDVHAFQIEATQAFKEVTACQANMVHLMLTRLMKAFEGKSRSVQYKIATTINSGVAIDESLNIYDIIQSICSDMATVGDVKNTVNNVNSVLEQIKCDFCGYRHKTEDCRKLKQAKADVAAGILDKLPTKAPKVDKRSCNNCGKTGHTANACPNRPVNSVVSALEQASTASTAGLLHLPPCTPAIQTVPQPVYATGRKFTPAEIQSLMSKLQSGEATVSMSHRTKQTARNTTGRLPPRLIKKAAHASSLESDGQPFGEYQGNRVLLHQHAQLRDDQPTTSPGHLTNTSLEAQGQPFFEGKGNRVTESIGLSFCDGIGCALLALNSVNALLTRYIAVESDPTARLVCNNVNDGQHGSITPDHTWASDVFDITEAMIIALGVGNIKLLCFGPPCQDHSKLRNIPRKGKPSGRPGLNGQKGRVFRKVLINFMWVMNHNPECEYFGEFVDCSDMTEDWSEICGVLGQPYSICHDIVSFTRRNRMYWTNMNLPADFGADWKPQDPNTCMDQGRTIIPYLAYGQKCVYPLGASWKGPSDNPRADTSRAIKVQDTAFDTPQDLRAHEAEQLMGIPPGRTAGSGTTVKQRLTHIGNGWDMVVILKFFAHSKLARVHTNPQYTPTAPVHPARLSDADIKLQCALVTLQLQSPDSLAQSISLYEHHQQIHMLNLLQLHHSGNSVLAVGSTLGSVLDSGSSRHINPSPVITDAEQTVSLMGFDNSQQWTQGTGYLPLEWMTRENDTWIAHDIQSVDAMHNISSPILSMGKLIRDGFDFFLGDKGKEMYLTDPTGTYTVRLELGMDDIVRLPHMVRTGKHQASLPSTPAAAVHRVLRRYCTNCSTTATTRKCIKRCSTPRATRL
jgi:hypothetical protein